MIQCDITGKGKQHGNNVSYSKKKSKKAWHPNLQTKHIFVDGHRVKLKLAVSTIRTLKKINKERNKVEATASN